MAGDRDITGVDWGSMGALVMWNICRGGGRLESPTVRVGGLSFDQRRVYVCPGGVTGGGNRVEYSLLFNPVIYHISIVNCNHHLYLVEWSGMAWLKMNCNIPWFPLSAFDSSWCMKLNDSVCGEDSLHY